MPLERRLFRDEVHRALRRDIVSGVLPPGTALRDADLATRFGTSKEPIRSALQRLQAEGFVTTRPQSGTRVAPLDERGALDALEVVRVLSIRAAELALAAPDAEPLQAGIAAMRDANDRFEQAAATGDPDAALDADDAFHDVLLDLAGNTAIARAVHENSDVLRRLELAQFGLEGGAESAARHRELIEACATRDVDRVRLVTAQIWQSLATHLSKGS